MHTDEFYKRMEDILGEEYPAFYTELTEKEPQKALRVNSLKTAHKAEASPFYKAEALPYAEDGFVISEGERIGNTPEHHSGMIYLQDPGAMASVCAVNVKAGWRVLDCCSAPGGKTGQAAARIGDSGFILANEYVPKRAKITVANLERLGVRNAIVTSMDTAELGKMFAAYFDLVITDVPCSGEGMFRKSDDAVKMWSPENVEACAKRQAEILENIYDTVCDGGYLLYSTCTYSPEENERNVYDFIRRHPDFSLVPVREEVGRVTSDGITPSDTEGIDLSLTRRFYPHVSRGEGQFIALMQRSCPEKTEKILYKDGTRPLTKEERRIAEDFLKENTEGIDAKLCKYGDNIVLVSHDVPVPSHSVFSAGVLLGEITKGRLIPSHQLFSAYGHRFKRREIINEGDERIYSYMRGEVIEAKTSSGSGYCSVIYVDAPVGGGKLSDGVIKNHYPKGLRLMGDSHR